MEWIGGESGGGEGGGAEGDGVGADEGGEKRRRIRLMVGDIGTV